MCGVSGSFCPYLPSLRRSTAFDIIKIVSTIPPYLFPTPALRNSWFHPHKITRFLFTKCLELETAMQRSSNGIVGLLEEKGLLPFETLNDFSFHSYLVAKSVVL